MQCTEVQPLFTDFADNTLTREELHALTDHLLCCPDCAREWREFRQTLALVHALEAQAPPADLLPGIQAKLAQKGIPDRIRALVEHLNFSLSIPAAAAIFAVAMLGGFLLKTSPLPPPAIFQSPLARTGATPSGPGEMPMARRLSVAPSTMFAVSHNGDRRDGDPASLARTALPTHLAPGGDAPRLLSPDMHVLIEDIDHDSRVALCREMVLHNWRLHHLNAGLFLVHLPQAELEDLHELLDRHRFVLVPAEAAETGFGRNKKVLTAAIRFH